MMHAAVSSSLLVSYSWISRTWLACDLCPPPTPAHYLRSLTSQISIYSSVHTVGLQG
jgi:hypothetical protein